MAKRVYSMQSPKVPCLHGGKDFVNGLRGFEPAFLASSAKYQSFSDVFGSERVIWLAFCGGHMGEYGRFWAWRIRL